MPRPGAKLGYRKAQKARPAQTLVGLGDMQPSGRALDSCLSCSFGVVPVIEEVTWTIGLPLQDTELSATFGDEIDVLIAPSYGPAWKSDYANGQSVGAASCVTTPAAIAGWPIMTVPAGLVHGLPVGLALVARPGQEWALLAAGRLVESVVAATTPLPRPSWVPPGRG